MFLLLGLSSHFRLDASHSAVCVIAASYSCVPVNGFQLLLGRGLAACFFPGLLLGFINQARAALVWG